MNKLAPLIILFIAAALSSQPVMAKGKDQAKEKHHTQSHTDKSKHWSDSRWENTNKQALESSEQGQERAEERRGMHEPQGYGEPGYRSDNPIDPIIDRNVDNVERGIRDFERRAVDGVTEEIRDMAPPAQPRRY